MYVCVHLCMYGFETVSKIPGSLWTSYVTKDDLEPLILKPVCPHDEFYVVLEVESRLCAN